MTSLLMIAGLITDADLGPLLLVPVRADQPFFASAQTIAG